LPERSQAKPFIFIKPFHIYDGRRGTLHIKAKPGPASLNQPTTHIGMAAQRTLHLRWHMACFWQPLFFSGTVPRNRNRINLLSSSCGNLPSIKYSVPPYGIKADGNPGF